MKPFVNRLLFTAIMSASACLVHAQTTINFTSPAFEIGKDSTGTVLSNSFTFALGSFGSFTPSSSNVADWATNFTSLGSTSWDATLTQYSGSANLLNNNTPFTTSNQGFVWGYNTQTIDATTEWVLLTNANWQFPTSGATPTVAWTSTDVGTYAALGILTTSTATDPYIQTARLSAVPEPSAYALLAGVACLGFMITRRRRYAQN